MATTALLLSWRLLHPPRLASDQFAKRGTAFVTLSVARAPLAGSAVTTTTNMLPSEARMSTGNAVLHGGEGSPPTIVASDAGAPSTVVLNLRSDGPTRHAALSRRVEPTHTHWHHKAVMAAAAASQAVDMPLLHPLSSPQLHPLASALGTSLQSVGGVTLASVARTPARSSN